MSPVPRRVKQGRNFRIVSATGEEVRVAHDEVKTKSITVTTEESFLRDEVIAMMAALNDATGEEFRAWARRGV